MMTLASVVETDWTLGELARAAGYALRGGGEHLPVSGVQEDSRRCAAGDLFVAVSGTREDGLRYVADALRNGAAAVVSERDPGPGVAWLQVEKARSAAARLADLVYGDPSALLPLVGVTGTNGKTSVAHLIAQLLPGPTGVIGTLGVIYPGVSVETANTTPGPTELRRHLCGMLDAGCSAGAMEVSSHALAQRRTEGLRFRVAVYTNLSGDHLDYHGSMESYEAAKARLFLGLDEDAVAVLNANDPACARIRTRARVVWYAPRDVRADASGTRFVWRGHAVRVPLLGRHNAENTAAALEAACALGADPAEAIAQLAGVLPVRGRLEPVQREPFSVIVDYAHTDDALDKALRAVRGFTEGRVILVFGCGGDRDRTKRPRMGRVAAQWADRVIVTSDNPRGEDPQSIAREIVAGMEGTAREVVLDRRAAIRQAVAEARPRDTILIAGKGHETYQLVNGARLDFDDTAEAQRALGNSP
jgi:UDP-N-acetylmuramoyl-L-alanyl-D-glutamate--2,6-diaminopimelate ligase